jgi:site-specific DNA-methyltransferase (cytosine-N4-specific)
MAFATSDIPFGAQFSPNQIELAEVLLLASKFGGNRKALEKAIRAKYFEDREATSYNKSKLANNAALGMVAYGIVERDGKLTGLGERLCKLRGNPSALYGTLARHILLSLRGLDLVQTAEDMRAQGDKFDLSTFRGRLQERGIKVPRGTVHMSSMRLWLEKAGVVVSDDWRLDYPRLEEVVGASQAEIDMLATLSREQKAYLKTLANVGTRGPHKSNEVERMASLLYGVKFDEKNLPKQVLYPLEEAGYVTLARGTREPGRGAKPFLVSVTEKFEAQHVKPLVEALEKQATPEIRPLLRKPVAQILEELSSASRHVKGLALEALAFHLMRLIGPSCVVRQVQADDRARLVAWRPGLVWDRWQLACWSGPAREEEVATEVGLMSFLRCRVACVVCVGTFSQGALRYADAVRPVLPGALVLVDRKTLRRAADRPLVIFETINSQAPLALARTR